MDCSDAAEHGEFLLIARRNNSLSCAGRAVVLGSLVALSLAISVAFAWNGAWLVFPFAGVEMLVLFLAFRAIEQHAGDFESIAIKGDRVVLEKWESGRLSRHELNRYWAQVRLLSADSVGGTMLTLRSHGKEIEFGRHLTEEGKTGLAQTLKQQLRNRA